MPHSRTSLLQPRDRAPWERLAREYHRFYGESYPSSAYDATWARLISGADIHGAGAYLDGRLVGIAHCLFHAHVWDGTVCYLQDLFVDDAMRGQGMGRALIEHVADAARERGAFRLYWSTRDDNAAARRLYDRIAQFNGFIRYDMPLAPSVSATPEAPLATRASMP